MLRIAPHLLLIKMVVLWLAVHRMKLLLLLLVVVLLLLGLMVLLLLLMVEAGQIFLCLHLGGHRRLGLVAHLAGLVVVLQTRIMVVEHLLLLLLALSPATPLHAGEHLG